MGTHGTQKRDQEDSRQITSCSSQTQPWKIGKQNKLLGYCLLHYCVLLDATVELLCFISNGSRLEYNITVSPRKRFWANGSRPSYYSFPHIIFPLHPTFPLLSNSFPLAAQDHSTSDRHILMKAKQRYGSG